MAYQSNSDRSLDHNCKMFAFQLCTFLSQSKHQKVQKMSQINQVFISKFIHLFQICNINRFIDYTEEFISQIRNAIMRLEIIQKKKYEYLQYKQDYVYLIIQGTVQKCNRPKGSETNNKRTSKFNNTGFNFNFNSSFSNTRTSCQTQNCFQLKEMQKSILTNRCSRMSFLSNISQVLTPKKRKKMFQTLSPNKFDFANYINEEDQSNQSNQEQKTKDVKLFQPLQQECFKAKCHVKAVKLLKWTYDQLVQYVFKYQSDILIKFLSQRLSIAEPQIKNNQIYNKSNYVYFKQRISGHTNQKISLNPTSLYLLRKGTVEFKYLCKQKISQKDINLADYHQNNEPIYKKIILNQGARILLDLQKSNQIVIQALQDIVFVQINKKLLDYLYSQVKDFKKNLLLTYKCNVKNRAQYMKDEQEKIVQKQKNFHLQNVCLRQSKKKSSKRFRTSNNIQIEQERRQILSGRNSQDYQEFISVIPYQIMVKSKQKISAKLNSKTVEPQISSKVFSYLKNIQVKKNKSKERMMELKLKTIAQKQIHFGELKQLQKSIKRKSKNKLQQTLNANWFNDKKDPEEREGHSAQNQGRSQAENNANLIGDNEENSQNKNYLKCVLTHRKQNHQSEAHANIRQNQIKTVQHEKNTSIKRSLTAFIGQQIPTNTYSSEQQFFSKDDTGLINKFVKYSHNYQKQISFLLNSNQKQSKVKVCKTEGNVFSHNLLKSLLKKYNKEDSMISNIKDDDKQNKPSKQNRVRQLTNQSVESTDKIKSMMNKMQKVKSFSKKRPATASTAKNSKTECRSTFLNHYIQTQTRDYQRKMTQVQGTKCSQSAKSIFYYKPSNFNSINNKKIFSQLQSGKIVKKSVMQADWNARKPFV